MRFFVYWKQREQRTDYDLSVLLLDDDFLLAGQVSWTNLSELGAVHSGDITEAPDGATEFIDLDLGRVSARYVVPQVNIYSGEGFDDAEEAFFGFMEREPEQRGRAVRAAHRARQVRPLRHRARRRCPCSSRAATTAPGTPSGCTSACAGTRSSTASRATRAARRCSSARSPSSATSSSPTSRRCCARAARRSGLAGELDPDGP